MNETIDIIKALCIQKSCVFHTYIDINNGALDIGLAIYSGNICVYLDNKSKNVDDMFNKAITHLNEMEG